MNVLNIVYNTLKSDKDSLKKKAMGIASLEDGKQ